MDSIRDSFMDNPILTSAEITKLENLHIADSGSLYGLITQMGLATAAQLRSIAPNTSLFFCVCPGDKGAIALTAAIELLHMNAKYKLNVCAISHPKDTEIASPTHSSSKDKKSAHSEELTDVELYELYHQLLERIPANLICKLPSIKNARDAVIVDGLYGYNHQPQQINTAILDSLNRLPHMIVAIKIPSGVDADTGEAEDKALECSNTIAFTAPLPCHMLLPGRQLSGSVHICPTGIEDEDISRIKPKLFCNTSPDFGELVPSVYDNKYSRGAVAIVASAIMPGATYLAAAAARKSGIGAVFILTPPEKNEYFQTMLPSAIVINYKSAAELVELLHNRKIATVVVGPGTVELSNNPGVLKLILGIDKPTVVDASALDALALIIDDIPKRNQPMVITPHKGEFARLFPRFSKLHPFSAVKQASKKINSVILLKGYTTLIATPNGEVIFNINARPELAVAGSGDVLSGIIGALLCRYDSAQEATAAACWWHSAAGRGFGLVAEDIINSLEEVVSDANSL